MNGPAKLTSYSYAYAEIIYYNIDTAYIGYITKGDLLYYYVSYSNYSQIIVTQYYTYYYYYYYCCCCYCYCCYYFDRFIILYNDIILSNSLSSKNVILFLYRTATTTQQRKVRKMPIHRYSTKTDTVFPVLVKTYSFNYLIYFKYLNRYCNEKRLVSSLLRVLILKNTYFDNLICYAYIHIYTI